MPPARSIFRVLPLLGVAVLAVMLVGCGGTTTYEWSQKITVVVSTPNGEVSGSSVQNIRAVKANKGFGGQPPGSEVYVTAEAVVVDLGETPSGSRFLFALIRGAEFIVPGIVAPKTGARTHEALETSASLPIGQQFALSGRRSPALVTFANINDPASVRRVDADHLAPAFGLGYALKAITLEITREPVTTGIVERVLGRKLGDGALDAIWQKLPRDVRQILSWKNWVRK